MHTSDVFVKTLNARLVEITSVRLACRKCKTVTEIPVENLCDIRFNARCCFCQADYVNFDSNITPLADLGRAIRNLQMVQERVTVELVAVMDDKP